MKGTAYETLVRRLAIELMANQHLQGLHLESGARHRILGVSGFSHQIDVSLRGEATLYLIEAKHWKRPVSVEAVLVLGSRLRDIAQATDLKVYASMVSTQPATSGAHQLAPSLRIRIDTVRSLQEYALQFGPQLFVGVTDGVTMSATAEAEHLRRCPRCGVLVGIEHEELGRHLCAPSLQSSERVV